MPAEVKIKEVALLQESFKTAHAIIVADYRGLSVAQMNDLRAKCREAKVSLRVSKNRLAKIALREVGLPVLEELLRGPTIFAMGMDDPVSPAKVLTEFAKAKENEALEIKGGLFEGKALSVSDVKQLASMPSREELYARLAGSLAAPSTNIARCISEVIGGLARVIKATTEAKAA